MYIGARLLGLALEAEVRPVHSFATLTVGRLLSFHAALSHPICGEPWIHAGWDQGIKGAVAVRVFWLYVEAGIPKLRQEYLNEDQEAILQAAHPASL